MPVGVALSQLVTDTRAEAGYSLTPAHNLSNEATLKYLLRRTEEELYIAHDWRGRIVNRYVPVQAGQRYCDYPSDMPFDNINKVYCENYTEYLPIEFGILPTDFSIYNSNTGVTSWPIQKWDHDYDQDMFELWPIPNTDSEIVLRGQLTLTPMIEDTDTCTLDSTLLVLSVALEILQRLNSAEASLKEAKLTRHMNKLRAQQSSHKRLPIETTPPRGPKVNRNMTWVTTRQGPQG